MRAALLSLAAVAALTVSAGIAEARPPAYRGGHHHSYYGGNYGYRGGYNRGYNNFYRPSYSPRYYGGYGYNSGFGLSIFRPRFGLTIGSGGLYSGYGSGYSPYYGGLGYNRWGW